MLPFIQHYLGISTPESTPEYTAARHPFLMSRTNWQRGNCPFSPIGYHRLGQAYPRTKLRQRYPDKRRGYMPNIHYDEIRANSILNIEYTGASTAFTSDQILQIESLLDAINSNNINHEYLRTLNGTFSPVCESSSLPTNLDYYWDFDSTGGGYTDNINSLALYQGTSSLSAGGKNLDYLLNAGSGGAPYVDFSYTSSLNHDDSPFTYSMWVYIDTAAMSSLGSYTVFEIQQGGASDKVIRTLIGYDGADYTLTTYMSGDGSTYSYVISSSSALPTNEWVLMTFVYDGSTLTQYVNGSYWDSNTAAGVYSVVSGTNRLNIGVSENLDNNHLTGRLDEFAFWSRDLSSAEVTELYNSGSGTFYPFSGDCPEYGSLAIEYLQGILTNQQTTLAIENLISLSGDLGANAEYLSSLSSSNPINVENLVGFNSEEITNLEYLLVLANDNNINIEYSGDASAVSADNSLPIEFILDLAHLKSTELEYLLSMSSNNLSQLENLVNLAKDNSIPVESLVGVVNGGNVSIENLLQIAQNNSSALENLLDFNTTQISSLEYLLGITRDNGINIEYAGDALALSADNIIHIEYITQLILDNIVNEEFKLELAQAQTITAEYLIALAAQYAANTELLAGVAADNNVNVEHIVNLALDQALNSEYSVDFSTLNSGNMEWLSLVGLSFSSLLEYLISTNTDIDINSEALGQFVSDGVLNFEFLSSFGVNQTNIIEWLVDVGVDSELAVEWSTPSTFNADLIINLEYLRTPAVLQKILRWIAVNRTTVWVAQDCDGTSWTVLQRPTDWVAQDCDGTSWTALQRPADWTATDR